MYLLYLVIRGVVLSIIINILVGLSGDMHIGGLLIYFPLYQDLILNLIGEDIINLAAAGREK